MARIDDYREAVRLGKSAIAGRNPKGIAEICGASFRLDDNERAVFCLTFLNRKIKISWPECMFAFCDSQQEVPIQQQILLLHYLNMGKVQGPPGEWISFQEVPDGKFYMDAFLRRAKNPMVEAFGHRPEVLVRLAEEAYRAKPFNQGDYAVVVQALPLVPVAMILWKGDDEFPPEGNILFDRSISDIFPAEDIAWLAGMIVYPLIGMAGKK